LFSFDGEAVKSLWPEVKLGIGPAIEDGFYYDFDKKEPFTDDDLLIIETKMREIAGSASLLSDRKCPRPKP